MTSQDDLAHLCCGTWCAVVCFKGYVAAQHLVIAVSELVWLCHVITDSLTHLCHRLDWFMFAYAVCALRRRRRRRGFLANISIVFSLCEFKK